MAIFLFDEGGFRDREKWSESKSKLKFLRDPSIASRDLSRLLFANLERTRDRGQSVQVGVCMRGLCVTLRPHIPTECVWVGMAGIREQGPEASASRLALRS